MPSFRTGIVSAVLSERKGIQRLAVTIGDIDQRAYNLTDLTGPAAIGDEVICNTTAVELGLGTGGWHFVHWNLSVRDLVVPGGGHIMKMRYTSLQADTGAAEEHHPDLPTTLDGIPVVVCSLHSQMAVVAATIGAMAPGTRVGYVMTDGAALPIAMSDLVHELRGRDLLCGTVTAGHAFGGDHEAVNVVSALTVARHLLDAEVIVVSMGPGVVGTGSALGTTALEVGPILDAARSLDGTAVACIRASDGDPRERHRGISHHTVTALRGRTGVVLPVPTGDLDSAHHAGLSDGVVPVEVPDIAAVLATAGLRVTTMGRGPDADPLFFRFAGAAAVAALRAPRP